MPRINLKKMSVADLVALRDTVQAELSRKIGQERGTLQKQIEALAEIESGRARAGNGAEKATGPRRVPGKRRGSAKGIKVVPKYRGPRGDTWTGRGNAPRWLAALEAEGKKRETFLIKK